MLFKEDAFEVVAPPRIKNSEILQFIRQYKKWMLKQLTHRQCKSPKSAYWPLHFLAGETLRFKDKSILLNVKFAKHKGTILEANGLKITVPWQKVTQEGLSDYVKQQVVAWYKEEAMIAVMRAIQTYGPVMGRSPLAVQIKKQKTRWGSCGMDKININWLLMLAPEAVLDYVVVHELCHLFHRNHGVRFWAKVEKFFPHYKQAEAWLSQHGQALYLT
ncbi:MAG: M48 family metallopeptidase [Proteobacteria bacterium]|nr:M48 family metallopeptidase [Pseudomonadota bacterium]